MDILANILTLAVNCVMAGYCLRQSWLLRERLRDVETNKMDIADLTDRFTGFQKRDGMRKVRAERTSEADLLAELKSAAVAPPLADPADIKAALRRKLRNH